MVSIRKIRLDDAEKYLALFKQLDEETIFRLYEPGEREITLDMQKENIREVLGNDKSLLLVAEDEGELVGYLMAAGRNIRRIAHCVHISIGILQSHTGKGIGTRMFEELEMWAGQNRIHRLELTVMENNVLGRKLYKKMGFELEGIKRHSLYVDGEYIDDIYMSKLI